MQEYKKILNYFIKDLTLLVQRIMIEKGVPKNSDLVRSVEFIPTNSGLAMLANDYYEAVSQGRKPKARKIPIENLIDWLKSYSIASGDINRIAWAIQQAIFVSGIKGKGFAEPVSEAVAEFTSEEIAKALEKFVGDELVAAFKPLTK